MSGKIYPTEKQKLLESLTPEEIKTLQKDNPFKHERDDKIYELIQRGVSCFVLADVVGLGKSSINRIGIYGSNRRHSFRQKNHDLKQIKEAFNAFSKQINKILNHRRK